MKVYIKNKIMTIGGSSVVLDEKGEVVYKIKGNWLSLTKKKRIYDKDGNLLYKLRNKFWRLFTRSVFIYEDGKKLCRVKDKYFDLHKQFFVEGLEDEIRTEGKIISLTYNILKNDEPMGVIRRQVDLFRDCFELEADEKDIPFLIALVIAIDNITDRYGKN